MWLWALGMSVAMAGEWREQPIETQLNTDFTAWTPGKNKWRLGLLGAEYGLLTNASIGIPATLLYAFGVYNARAKVTAIQSPKFDASLQGSWYSLSLPQYDITVRPIGWTGSWTPREKFSLHFGHSWYLAEIEGMASPSEIGEALYGILGVDISQDLTQALGGDGGLYAGANLSLQQFRLAAEYHLNRRDSIIFTSNTFRLFEGLMAGGVAVDSGTGTDVSAGASLRISTTSLTDVVPASTTLSWQLSWPRFHLRLGLPLPVSNITAYPQAIEMFWLLGPRKKKGVDSSAPVAPAP